jgi:mRNA-degrading endonuclease toxin of MazEF toxin-antitoxin module
VKRGEIWWAELDLPIGNRPVVILTRDSVLSTIDSVTFALVTRNQRFLPTEIELGRAQGLTRSVVSLDNILTAKKARLKRLLGSLNGEKLEELDQKIKLALGVR